MSKINNKLEDFAFDILVDNDMLKVPVDLIALANNNNIKVYKKELPQGISGAIRYSDELDTFQILISEDEPYNRKRFTLAHELAHYFLEKDKLQLEKNIHFDTKYRRISDKEEIDVDYLAGALLMNKTIIKELYDINPSVKILAKLFRVSESAMFVRLKTLGLK